MYIEPSESKDVTISATYIAFSIGMLEKNSVSVFLGKIFFPLEMLKKMVCCVPAFWLWPITWGRSCVEFSPCGIMLALNKFWILEHFRFHISRWEMMLNLHCFYVSTKKSLLNHCHENILTHFHLNSLLF